jgi:phytoene synthase
VSAPDQAINQCARDLRLGDHDRYLTTLFARPPMRVRLVALYAFNLDLARVPEAVSEPLLGEIRLQWWRETIESSRAGSPRDLPVARALSISGAAGLMREATVGTLINARARELEPVQPANRAALEKHAEESSSALLSLALDILEINDVDARLAARSVGLAWAIVGTIRSIRVAAERGRTLSPPGVGAEDMAGWAREHLAAARAYSPPREALPVLLLASLADIYLMRLAAAKFDPLDPRLEISPLARQLRLMWRAAINRP